MAKIWKSEEFVWKREGFIKKSEEFLWKNDEFVSWKVNEFIWPNDILCDVNCILSKCFQVQLWGCPGKPKFQFHILCGRGRLIYIPAFQPPSPPGHGHGSAIVLSPSPPCGVVRVWYCMDGRYGMEVCWLWYVWYDSMYGLYGMYGYYDGYGMYAM